MAFLNTRQVGGSLLNLASNAVQTTGIAIYAVGTVYFGRHVFSMGCQFIKAIPQLTQSSSNENDNNNNSNSITLRQFFNILKNEATTLIINSSIVGFGVGVRWVGGSMNSTNVQKFLFGDSQ